MERLDKFLVNNNLAPTRAKSQELIKNSCCFVNGRIITKCNYMVNNNDSIEIQDDKILKYVSRGGLKLKHALNVFGYDLTNKVMMDIGSSTGGFSDCALKHGIKKIIAVDVGTNVMHESLRHNAKIDLHEQTNIKDLSDSYFHNIDLITIDVSFISLIKIIEIINKKNITVDMIVLIKPQFECGKEIALKYKGIILNKDIHINILNNMIESFNKNRFYLKGIDVSPIKGGDGNIEYIAYITNKEKNNITIDITDLVNNAFINKK